MTDETFQQLILSHHHFPGAILNLMQGFDVGVLRKNRPGRPRHSRFPQRFFHEATLLRASSAS